MSDLLFKAPEKMITIDVEWTIKDFADGIFKPGDQITSPNMVFYRNKWNVELLMTESNEWAINFNDELNFPADLEKLPADIEITVINNAGNIMMKDSNNTKFKTQKNKTFNVFGLEDKSLFLKIKFKIKQRIFVRTDEENRKFICITNIYRPPDFKVKFTNNPYEDNIEHNMIVQNEIIEWNVFRSTLHLQVPETIARVSSMLEIVYEIYDIFSI